MTPLILGDAIEGESRELGIAMAGIARSVRLNGHPVRAPAVLLSGGETTVTIGKGPAGRGGRNTEFLLGFALAIAGEADVFALAGDSDGIDGTEDAAGAIVTPDTLARAAPPGSTRARCWPHMIATASLTGSAISFAPARPAPMSTTSAPS